MTSPAEPSPATLEELRRVPVLEGIPDEVLEWFLHRSDVVEYADGEVTMRTGDPIDHLLFILAGSGDFHMDVKGRLVHWFTFSQDPPTLGVGGVIPYSRLVNSPGWMYARGPLRVLRLHKEHFRELEQVSPELVQRLIATMTERARYFATRKIQEEKISALGKLAAGLAHELNNPAAAIQRTVTELSKRLERNYELTAQLIESGIAADEVRRVNALVASAAEQAGGLQGGLMARMDLEDVLKERLASFGVADPEALAETLVETGVNEEGLEEMYRSVEPERFPALMRWLCNILLSSRVIHEVGEASARISALVNAIKSHVYMDRSQTRQPVTVHQGLDHTLTILNHKLRKKNIQVERSFEPSLPDLLGYGGELNQVWTNLIDNAIDAMGQEGRLRVTTCREGEAVRVTIADDGKGIPPEHLSQIFDPFFTTKQQGEGTGIGLDIVRQVVDHHHGEVRVSSVPGKTEFHVILPLSPPPTPDLPADEEGTV